MSDEDREKPLDYSFVQAILINHLRFGIEKNTLQIFRNQ
jgi:hypothetical protein